jgi:hypothetical protein
MIGSKATAGVVAVVAALAVTAPGGLARPAMASASPWDSHVHVRGHIDCGGLDSPEWVWYQASNGERGFAKLSPWTRVSRAAGSVWRLVKVPTYDIHLWKVGGGSGTSLTLTVGCNNALLGARSSFTDKGFGVARPRFGTLTTVHVCRNAVLGCWV